MGAPVYMIGGGKGGVGKSLVSIALVDYLIQSTLPVHLVDADSENPDVAKALTKSIPVHLINLDVADGWSELIDVAAEHPDAVLVINTPARSGKGFQMNGELLSMACKELRREMTTLWVINRQRDSLELLNKYLNTVQQSTTHVVLNLYFGEANQFTLYENSQVKKRVTEQGGVDLLFPEVASRVTDQLNAQRLSVAEGMQALSLGNRLELQRWRKKTQVAFDKVIDIESIKGVAA